jgi:NAD(P)-dependent dehydrogenase (short-subunit alcohol dehydrogenase family)
MDPTQIAAHYADPTKLFDLHGKVAVVTGATGALGRVAALTLGGAGASVVIAGANESKLDQVAAEVQALGGTVRIEARRPASPEDAEAIVAAATTDFGAIDIVVSASGLNIPSRIEQMDPADFDAVQDANVRQSWLLCRAAGSVLLDQGRGGKVILISSTRGRHGLATGYTAYCASKAAVDLITKSLACEWGAAQINVNAIAPTIFRSKLTAWMYADDARGRETRDANLARIPLGRLGEPEDLAGSLLFLASPASDFVTGHVLYADGGYTAA